MTVVYIAWLLLAGWLFTYAGRVLIADPREFGREGDVSWCDCEIPEEVTR